MGPKRIDEIRQRAQPHIEVTPSGLDRITTAQVDVQNFALITHAVPAERLQPLVPDRFQLETFVDGSGAEMGFISASTFCNRQIHWSAARYPAHDFDQSTFRTYVTHRGRRGAYFFATYVSTRLSFVGQSLVAANTRLAEFDVDIDRDERGYRRYVSHARAGSEELQFELEAIELPTAKPLFASGEEHAQFITYRLHGYARPPVGGVTYGPIEHRHMDPWEGRLIEGRFDLWETMGLLPRDEWDSPFSVLVEPSVRFTLHPPRPAGPDL
jgi:uncharacterized protein YqjF (DUF2071 family)